MKTHPQVDSAFQFWPVWRAIGACAKDAPVWFLQAECDGKAKVWADDEEPYCMIDTPIGRMRANSGDWIARDVFGNLHIIKDVILSDLKEDWNAHEYIGIDS